jgi:dihydroflavonol-4-reductase
LAKTTKPKILVTGASGFIGSKLVRRLCEKGYKVRTFGRSNMPASVFSDLKIEHYGGDITNPEQVKTAVEGCKIIYHLAGLVSYRKRDIQRQYGVNVLGTRHVLEAAVQHKVERIIHTSSVAAMGIPAAGTIGDESIEYNLMGKGLNYCDSKFEAEQQILHFFREQSVPVLMLNPGIVFGEGDTHPHHHAIFAAMSKGNLIGVPPGGVTFSDINDVVEAHINAMTMGRPGERYALVSANLTFKEAAAIFSKIMGTRPPVMVIPGPLLVAGGSLAEIAFPLFGKNPPVTKQVAWLSQHKIFFSSKKAEEELAFKATPFEETVARISPYYLGLLQKDAVLTNRAV